MLIKVAATLLILVLTALLVYASAYVFSAGQTVVGAVQLGLVALMLAGLWSVWVARWRWAMVAVAAQMVLAGALILSA